MVAARVCVLVCTYVRARATSSDCSSVRGEEQPWRNDDKLPCLSTAATIADVVIVVLVITLLGVGQQLETDCSVETQK